MKAYAVIDTNVLVSALINWDSVPGTIIDHMLTGDIIPITNENIIKEYDDVLRRKKFRFNEQDIQKVLDGIRKRSIFLNPSEIEEILPDPKDVVFYAVTMEARKTVNAFLVTGNMKHFPVKPFIVTPREMLTVLENTHYHELLT